MREFRPGGFSIIPPVIKNLIIFNVLVFLAQQIFQNSPNFSIENLFALHDIHSIYFRPHQLVTFLFLHGSWGHLFFNMFALWMFGSILENLWGGKRFLVFYMACGIGSALLHLGVLYFEMKNVLDTVNQFGYQLSPEQVQNARDYVNLSATLGASGAIFGCLAAFGYLFPNSLIYLYFFIPIKAKWFVIFYGAMELFLGVQNSAGDNVAHWAHLGGAAVGLAIVYFWNKNNRRNFY